MAEARDMTFINPTLVHLGLADAAGFYNELNRTLGLTDTPIIRALNLDLSDSQSTDTGEIHIPRVDVIRTSIRFHDTFSGRTRTTDEWTLRITSTGVTLTNETAGKILSGAALSVLV